jgi:NADH:ubiquinone oxidoreductase subunit E
MVRSSKGNKKMLIITICVGSSCRIRGSDEVAAELERLIEKEKLEGLVDIVGAFCMDTCSKGVSVRIGDQAFSGINPQDTEDFFYKEILPNVNSSLLS